MKYYEVEAEVMRGAPVHYTVASDGAQCADEWESDWEQEVLTGYSVAELGEDGRTENYHFYPVQTNTRDWTNNGDEVLEQIKQDYPATEWQNNEW